MNPNLAEAHKKLGFALLRQFKFLEAEKSFLEAIRINPDDAEAYNNLGTALGEQGRTEEEIPKYYEAIRVDPNYDSTYINLASAFMELGKYKEAEEALNTYTRLRTNDPLGFYMNALVLEKQGQNDKAQIYLRKTLTLETNPMQIERIKLHLKRLIEGK